MRTNLFSLSIICFSLFPIIGCSSSKSINTSAADNALISPITIQDRGELSPMMFGARGDGKTDDSEAFQKMFDEIQRQGFGKVNIPSKSYFIGKTVLLPDRRLHSDYLFIEGNGAVLNSNGNYVILGKMSNSNKSIGFYNPIISGITFKGSNKGIGLQLNATYTASVTNCHFRNLETGLLSRFSLNGLYQNLRFTNCKTRGFVGTYGDWKGATVPNSAFNGNLIQNCRVNGRIGQYSHFEIIAGDHNTLSNCISEGSSPRYNVVVDSKKSSVIEHFINVDNFWIESYATSSDKGSVYFKFINQRGVARLNGIQAYPKMQKDTLLENLDSKSHCQIIINAYRGNTHLINNNSSKYGSFYIIKNTNPRPNNAFPHLEKSNWVGGVIPLGLVLENYRSQNSGQFSISDNKKRKEKK